MTDEEAIAEFLNYIAHVKNYSENTVLGYQKDILEFKDFLKSEKMAPNLFRLRPIIPKLCNLSFEFESCIHIHS